MSERIGSAIAWACGQIRPVSESAKLDAELLLAHCLDKPRSYVYSWPEHRLSNDCWQQYRALIQRRQKPTPIAYLLGKREFYSLEFMTSAVALVPRPETELLVETALSLIPLNQPFRVLELGTGSGIIAVTLKHQRPLANVVATDLDQACLALAESNASQHGVDIDWHQSDWYVALKDLEPFDLIVSNPPYIAASHPFLQLGDLPAEPKLALTPGETGMEALDKIIAGAPEMLLYGGLLMVEHGFDQQVAVSQSMQKHAFQNVVCEFDFNQLPRVSFAQRIVKPKDSA